jgi:hypothetical protein
MVCTVCGGPWEESSLAPRAEADLPCTRCASGGEIPVTRHVAAGEGPLDRLPDLYRVPPRLDPAPKPVSAKLAGNDRNHRCDCGCNRKRKLCPRRQG